MKSKYTFTVPDVDLTFEAIDLHIQSAGLDALRAQAAAATSINKRQRLLAAYTAVRPILVALSLLPLLPANWRLGLSVFVEALDGFVAAPPAAVQDDFKAGKDL